jgi:hypothetical protein
MSLPSERVAGAVFVVLVIAYAAILLPHTCEVAGGSDSSGYANEARGIGRGQVEERIGELDRFGLDDSFTNAFVPLGYVSTRPHFATPTYPPGLPVHMAVAGLLFGWSRAPFFISPLSAIAGVILLRLFARKLSGSWWIAIGAAFSLGFCVTYVFMGVSPMSDVLTTTWSIAAVGAAWKSRDGDARWAAAAGAALAISVWVRPSNVLLGLPVLFALPWTKKALAWCVASGAIVTAPLLVWNARRYGSPFRSGYGSIADAFRLSNFASHSWHYLFWTGALLTPLVLAGAVYSLIRAPRERIHLVLALWFWPFFFFFALYDPYETWWYTRFLLPSYPALILSTIFAARAIPWRHAVTVALCAIALTGAVLTIHWDILGTGEGEMIYPNAVRWAEAEIPPDSIVMAMQFSGARRYYKREFSLRYDWLDADSLKKLEAKIPPDRWYALVSEWEMPDLMRHVGGRWTQLGEYRDVVLLHRDPNGAISSKDLKGNPR